MLRYDYVDDILERRGAYREQHLALLTEHGCMMGGAIGDPVHGALIVFETAAQAEAFTRVDPYVANGLVTEQRIEPWALAIRS